MASSEAGTALSNAHRLAQTTLSARTLRRLGITWRVLDPRRLDATAGDWVEATIPVLNVAHRESQTLAAAYVGRFRAAELADVDAGPLPTIDFTPLDEVAARRGLLIQGPVKVKQAMTRGRDLQDAYRDAFSTSSAEATMRVSDGGRDVIRGLSEADRWAKGYRRVCSGKPCAFCAMLSSREYFGMPTVGFQVHPNCHCYPELIYGERTATRQSRQFAAQWSEATEGVPAGDQLNAFRRYLDAERA